MKDCSVVTATYDLGDGLQGTIGIIGPKRMDYEKVMHNLNTVKESLNELFRTKKVTDEVTDDEVMPSGPGSQT
jgi:heat-inducible transcriptional repressor